VRRNKVTDSSNNCLDLITLAQRVTSRYHEVYLGVAADSAKAQGGLAC
jgi:hypothetical protein